MCNPNSNSGANALDEIVSLLQKIALDSSKQPTINVNCPDSNGMLQKILEAVEKNSKKVDELSDRLVALEKCSGNVDDVKERLASLEWKIYEIDSKVEKTVTEQFVEVKKRAAERTEAITKEFKNLRQKQQATEKMVQDHWEKVSSLMTSMNEGIRQEQKNHSKKIEEQLENIEAKLEEQQKILSKNVDEKGAVVPLNQAEEEETLRLVIRIKNKQTGIKSAAVVMKVKKSDRLQSVRLEIHSKLDIPFGRFYNKYGFGIDDDEFIHEMHGPEIHEPTDGEVLGYFY